MALRSGRVGIHPSQVDPITGMLLNGPTPGSISFEDLSDAQITDPEIGQTLQYNGTGWHNVFASISPTTLAELRDVEITDPEDGEYLTYDSTNEKWVNSGAAPGPEVPDGKTVLPTDDIQKWLNCAGIFDKVTYTTLADVLADSTTLLALMSDNNAVDYLVRSTTWASGVTANSTAMTDIGANNYCANTLLDDATWLNAICNSTYFESVLNTKVPTLTEDTSDITGSSRYNSGYTYYLAFNGNTRNGWLPASASLDSTYIQYEFPSPVQINKFSMYFLGNNWIQSGTGRSLKITGSNDGTNFTPISSEFQYTDTDGCNSWSNRSFTNSTSYQYIRVQFTSTLTSGTNYGEGYNFQLYGRQDI